MNAKTLKALKGSIRKWTRIVAGRGLDDGAVNCPLCDEFYSMDCAGCPVQQKSKRTLCLGTPYVGWADKYVPQNESGTGYDFSENLEALRLAHAELAFLKSLLPKRRKK